MLPRGSIVTAVTRLMTKCPLDHMGGAGERGIGRGLVAVQMHEADVVRAVVPDPRRARRHASGGRDHRRQRFVVDLDQLGRIHRLQVGLRHHEGDVIADPAHPFRTSAG